MTALFCTLDSQRIAKLIRSAKRLVCYAGPGVRMAPARALAGAAERLGIEMVTVSLDFNERAMRMGFGELEAVQVLRAAGILVCDAPGLRAALVVVDDDGYMFTPTALYLEAEPHGEQPVNAMCLSKDQLREALARVSPAAKAIAVAQAPDDQERERIASLPVEVGTEPVSQQQFQRVDDSLKEVPPVEFDLARQVRVYAAYLQYVELKLTGAAIQRRRLTIPSSILKLGGSKDLEGRLKTTFDLIERDSKLSSKKLEEQLNEMRRDFTRSLGRDHGRVVLKRAKPILDKRLQALRDRLEAHQTTVVKELNHQLESSRKQIVDYYLPLALENPPDAMLGGVLSPEPTVEDARRWLNAELSPIFPKAEALTKEMRLVARYKDMTFETLNDPGFLRSIRDAYPEVDWDKPYAEFRAAGEAQE